MWFGSLLITGWVALGSWVAIFPGTIERWTGLQYDFFDTWGVHRGKYEALTLGTLAVVLLLALVGYALGAPVRRREVAVPLEVASEAAGALAS
jgi:hypothetical protein